MKRLSFLFPDIFIILLIGFFVSLIDIMFTYFDPKMLNIIGFGAVTGLIIGCSIMLTDFLLYRKKFNIAFYIVFLMILLINGTGVFTASYVTGNKNIYKTAAIFAITMFFCTYTLYTKRKLKKDLNYYLDRKKTEIKENIK